MIGAIHKRVFNPLGPDGSYMIHRSDGRSNCPEAKGLVDNTNLLSTKKLIGRLNVGRPLLIYQREPFGSKAIVSLTRPMESIRTQKVNKK